MRISLLNKIIYGFILCVSCSSLKNLDPSRNIKVLNEKKLLDSIKAHEIYPQWMKIRGNAKVKINDDGEQEMEINLRSKIDSAIWINISKFKKKIFRTLLKKDSIKMTIEYPEKIFFDGSTKSFNNLTGISLNYNLIEELINGGSYLKYIDHKFKLQFLENNYHLQTHFPKKTKKIPNKKANKNTTYIYESWIDPINYYCNRVNIINPENNSEINISYNNWKNFLSYNLPTNIQLIISNNDIEYFISMNFKSIKLDQPQKFPFISTFKDYKLFQENE